MAPQPAVLGVATLAAAGAFAVALDLLTGTVFARFGIV